MKLYCECGNSFQITRMKDEQDPSRKCPMCGRQATTEKPKAVSNSNGGGREVQGYGGIYSFRTIDGMGGKIPRRGWNG
jgi:hypothetical protein